MKVKNKVFNKIFRYFLMGFLIILSPLLLAEKHDQHKETLEHSRSEHEEHDSHRDEHDSHDEDKKGDHGKEHQDENGDDHNEHGHDETAMDVDLSKYQMQKAGIETMLLKKQSVSNTISALSEVKLNQYQTINVSPTISSIRVEKRHVRLGDWVNKGALLVTLHTLSTPDLSANISSDKLSRADLNASITTSIAEMDAKIAQAKGDLAIATATWNRLRLLGKDAIAGKRYTTAKIAREQALAKLKVYQQGRSKIKKLGGFEPIPLPFVQEHYNLRAEQSGMVIKDDFVIGQVVSPEDVLFIISNMNRLWVEANIKPKDASQISIGSKATITAGANKEEHKLTGKVIFIGRILNEKTRTLPVRIEVNTTGASLYPGQFVKTEISGKSTQSEIVVPAEAVLRSADGDWMLFVEETPGRFEPKEVELIKNLGDNVVIEGIDGGTTIVSKGAFFVQSEMAKGGFEVHNH